MFRLKFAAAAVAAFIASAFGSGGADATTFNWTFSGSHFYASGTLDATFQSGDTYLVTALTGSASGEPLALSGGSGGDNLLLYPGSPAELDGHGLEFVFADAPYSAHEIIYYSSGAAKYFIISCAVGCSNYDTGVFSASLVTPLPAAAPMFAAGLGIVGTLAWRRNRQRAAA